MSVQRVQRVYERMLPYSLKYESCPMKAEPHSNEFNRTGNFWLFVRNMCISLRNPMAPEKPLPGAYKTYLAMKDKFAASKEMTHNMRGRSFNTVATYGVAPFACAIFLPSMFLQKCLGNRK